MSDENAAGQDENDHFLILLETRIRGNPVKDGKFIITGTNYGEGFIGMSPRDLGLERGTHYQAIYDLLDEYLSKREGLLKKLYRKASGTMNEHESTLRRHFRERKQMCELLGFWKNRNLELKDIRCRGRYEVIDDRLHVKPVLGLHGDMSIDYLRENFEESLLRGGKAANIEEVFFYLRRYLKE